MSEHTYQSSKAKSGSAIVVVRVEGMPGLGTVYRASTIKKALEKAAVAAGMGRKRRTLAKWTPEARKHLSTRYRVIKARELAAELSRKFHPLTFTRAAVIGEAYRQGLCVPK